MQDLIKEISGCRLCADYLPHGVNPVFQFEEKSRIAIIGQAPGERVHQSGVAWDDRSGDTLREWLGVSKSEFYDGRFAMLPMGFCYPGSAKSGDLPPRPECAPAWHHRILERLPDLHCALLIGSYAQNYYLGNQRRTNLTETVRNFREYLPEFFVLPHPSPRNRPWMAKNEWFETDVLPELRKVIVTKTFF